MCSIYDLLLILGSFQPLFYSLNGFYIKSDCSACMANSFLYYFWVYSTDKWRCSLYIVIHFVFCNMMSCWRMKNLPSAEIQLEKNDRKSVYFTGETISGKLILHTNESISYDDLRFSFIGNSEEVLKSVPFTMPTISITRNTLLYETVIHLSLPSTENNSLVSNVFYQSYITRISQREYRSCLNFFVLIDWHRNI